MACRNVEAPLRRAERAASWTMEFMMIVDGIDDGGWSFRSRGGRLDPVYKIIRFKR